MREDRATLHLVEAGLRQFGRGALEAADEVGRGVAVAETAYVISRFLPSSRAGLPLADLLRRQRRDGRVSREGMGEEAIRREIL